MRLPIVSRTVCLNLPDLRGPPGTHGLVFIFYLETGRFTVSPRLALNSQVQGVILSASQVAKTHTPGSESDPSVSDTLLCNHLASGKQNKGDGGGGGRKPCKIPREGAVSSVLLRTGPHMERWQVAAASKFTVSRNTHLRW